MNKTKAIGSSAVLLYFIIGLEITIMISPFAGFFYSAFNPFLLGIAKYPATRWLSSFFLPHMVVPPDGLLKSVRVMGSVLFVSGMAGFLLCAVQVYANKFLKKGTALRGLYSAIRHPQYVMLAVAGVGLSVLWPRFLVAVLWLLMVLVYYFLARDEERRMLRAYPETYGAYMEKTGMFVPKKVEGLLPPLNAVGRAALFTALSAVVIGGAFFLRGYTVEHLPVWTGSNVSALAVVPEDMEMMEHHMPDVLGLDNVKSHLEEGGHYLVYFLPADYIMQGLIADTGGDWKLYKRHHTASMITDWIFHPFSHLTEGHRFHHEGPSHSAHAMQGGVVRRLLFLKIEGVPVDSSKDLLAINARRVPVFMLDVEVHNMAVLDFRELPRDTGWGTVPTPVF